MISNYSGNTLIINSENYDLDKDVDKKRILTLVENNLTGFKNYFK